MNADKSCSAACKICKENIRPDSVICTHCGHFQNWRRHLGLSSSFLSIILAIISVLTVFMTVASDFATKNDSDINASVVGWQRAFTVVDGKMMQILSADIFITNKGKKPGAVKSVSVKGYGDEKPRHFQSSLTQIKNEYSNLGIDSKIVEPGNTLLLKRYLITNLTVDVFEKRYANSTVFLDVINFSGDSEGIELKLENKVPILFN